MVFSKKAEYELSEVGSSIESQEKKSYQRNRSFKNLLKVDYYLLFVFTLFLSIVCINIFIACSTLKRNYQSGISDLEIAVKSVEDFINYIPTNFSSWINEQSSNIDSIGSDIVIYAVQKPTEFINRTINEFVDDLNVITSGSIHKVNLELNIGDINIPEIQFSPWNLDIPISKVMNVLQVIVDIPYYFGVACLIITILFIAILFGRGISMVFDYRSRFQFLCRTSFWIGMIFGILFIVLTVCFIIVHVLYVENVGKKIEDVQRNIEEDIALYNHFMDENAVLVGKFMSDNLNILVNKTNDLVEQLRKQIENNVNQILNTNIHISFDPIDLVNIIINFEDFKVDPDIIDLRWINEKINSVLIGIIVFCAVIGVFFFIMVGIVCCDRK